MIIINGKEITCMVEGCEGKMAHIKRNSATCAKHKGTKTKMPPGKNWSFSKTGSMTLEGGATLETRDE